MEKGKWGRGMGSRRERAGLSADVTADVTCACAVTWTRKCEWRPSIGLCASIRPRACVWLRGGRVGANRADGPEGREERAVGEGESGLVVVEGRGCTQ